MNPAQFREFFPALRGTVWLDTPAAPPGTDPVVQALRDAVSAWFSWVGACAALRLLCSLDAGRVERHCLDLATRFTSHAADLGLARVTGGPPSQIVVVRTAEAERLAGLLRQQGIRATALGDRLRFGFHYFNNGDDLARTVRALSYALGRGVRSVRT